MERFVELALPAQGARPAGFVGKITSNSFMKREFGKKLVTQFFAKWDLAAAVDTSGAYIPGHGTPTVVLFLRNQKPATSKVRAVLGIRGEQSTPDDPANGLVWRAILDQIDRPGSQSAFVSVEDRAREMFAAHPWSLSGGGAGDVKAAIEAASARTLGAVAAAIGFGAVTREDEVYLIGRQALLRAGISSAHMRPLVEGDKLRDWQCTSEEWAIWPYDPSSLKPAACGALLKRLWPQRTQLAARVAYGQTQLERGLHWFEYSMFFHERFRTRLSIALPLIATHNHFVLDVGGRVFKDTAPVIKLKPDATEDDHLALLGVLNSSTIGFWGRQVMFNKGSTVDSKGARQTTVPWDDFYVWNSTNVGKCPLATDYHSSIAVSRAATETAGQLTARVTRLQVGDIASLATWATSCHAALATLIALQEELDWLVYRLYGLTGDASLEWPGLDSLPPVKLGERAFEIVMARKMAKGELQTTWFERHGSTPITEVPSHWPAAYQALVRARIEAMEREPAIGLIEQPEFKRRWNHEPWEDIWRRALTERFLDKVEALAVWRAEELRPMRVAELADILARDPEAVSLAEHLTGTEAPEMAPFLAALVKGEHVPCAAGARYTESGVRKRRSWEATWDLQRKEDAIDALAAAGKLGADEAKTRKKREVGDIPVPPKYDSKDFRTAAYWQARGKLDVPKERFISYTGAAGEKPTDLTLGWAGWDHFQQAKALVALFDARHEAGAGADVQLPLLQGLAELLPWLSQWFGDHPEFGDIGAVYRGAWQERLGQAQVTAEAVAAWVLPKATRGGGGTRRKGKKSTTAASDAAEDADDERTAEVD
jgi:hypothetical protein